MTLSGLVLFDPADASLNWLNNKLRLGGGFNNRYYFHYSGLHLKMPL